MRQFLFLLMGLFVVITLSGYSHVADDSRTTTSELNELIATSQDTMEILNVYKLNITERDLKVIQTTWSEDARWLNAFGRVFVGRDAIMNWLEYLYGMPGYAASHISRQDNPEIKFLRPDVVVIHEYHEREGQIINNQVTPTRKINSTYILTKENGIWLIRDKVTMDERERSN